MKIYILNIKYRYSFKKVIFYNTITTTWQRYRKVAAKVLKVV